MTPRAAHLPLRWALVLLLFSASAANAAGCALPEGAARLVAEATAAINAARKANSRAPLARDDRLDAAAQGHACWMAANGKFSHRGQGGSLPKRRIKATGYRTMLTAENIAWGQNSGAQVVAEWMRSPAHRQNILRSGIDEVGVGLALMQGRIVWVADFAAK